MIGQFSTLLQWFYDSDTPGVLKLAAQVADSGSSNIPASSTLVLLNEQDSKGNISLSVNSLLGSGATWAEPGSFYDTLITFYCR